MSDYSKAQRMGLKEYRKCIANGEHPFLPVLDEMIPLEKSVTGVDLGIVQIPTELIVGTKTAGRTNDFAKNFMPIADEKSEFARKWESLCQSHLDEGIREPIVAWEFLNRFYVQEGNKRVSVLKYFDAVSVTGRVKRIMPTVSDNIKIKIYYEFVDFYKLTGINFIEFSRLGSYKELQTLVGKGIKEKWNDDEVKRFKTIYYYFLKCYRSKGGDSLKSTVGDAFLAYIRVYGYSSLFGLSDKDMMAPLTKIWKEITLQQEDDLIDVKLDPDEPKKKIIPSIILKKKKVAFIYGDLLQTSGWRENHNRGMAHVQSVFEDKIEVLSYIVEKGDTEPTIRKAINDGATIVFATEPNMLNGCLKVAALNSNVKIFCCSLNTPHRLIYSYYPRMYEAKFIAGAIAGAMTSTNKVGYICKYPIYGAIAEINAFARGVQLTNPNAKVCLEWSSNKDTEVIQHELIEKNCDYISFRDYGVEKENIYRRFGLAKVEGDSLSVMALPIWNWGQYYERILQSILDGTFESKDEKTSKSLNYYWGIRSGVVELVFSEKLPKGVRYLAEVLYRSFQNGNCHPFFDPEKGADGNYIWDDVNKTLNIETIINMDWLEENIEGVLPKYEELDPVVKKIVEDMGIQSARKEAQEES